MPRPSQLPTWATSGTNIVEPASGRKIAGWLNFMAAAAGFLNWWQNLVYLWVAWFEDETRYTRHTAIAHALTHAFFATDILSNTHNWHVGAVSNVGSNGLVSPRYWVVGDNGSGNTAIAWAQAGVAGSNWANATGSATAGSLNRCAASGTLCLGVVAAGAAWKLGGSSSENGNIAGTTFIDVVHDATNNLWVAICSAGIYTSPMTGIAWTQRSTFVARCIAYYGGRLVAVGNGGIYYSTNGTSWTAGWVDTSANWITPDGVAANSLGFWIVDSSGSAPRIFFTADGITVTEHAAAPSLATALGTERIWSWCDVICLPGVYMNRDPRVNQWLGASYTAGVAERIAASPHGAIACNGNENATVFGPTIDFTAVPYAA